MAKALAERSVSSASNSPRKSGAKTAPVVDWLIFGLLFGAALLCIWLPIDWTRNLKRHYQDIPYFWLAVGYIVAYSGAVIWFWRRSEAIFEKRWWLLLALVIIPNLLNIWLRYTLQTPVGEPLYGRDADIGLFYKYGHDFATGLPPTFKDNPMEYPQGGLLLFWLGEQLAGGEIENFFLAFPLVMLFWHVVAAASLYGIGLKVGRPRAGFLLAVFTAGAPYLLQYNYTRFDIAPAGMLLAATYFFLPGSKEGFRLPTQSASFLTGVATAAGFLTKWLPALAAPFMVMAYLQTRRWKSLLIFGGTSAIISLAVMLPFYLADSYAFFYPYTWQGSRKLMGESFWFLVQYFLLDPTKSIPARPWGEPKTILLSNNLLQILQLGLVGLIFLITLWTTWRHRHWTTRFDSWAAGGLLAVAVFTLANRVFSPQYMVLVMWALAAVFVLQNVNRVSLIIFIALITFASYCNFLVFHLAAFEEQWVPNSVKFFGLSWLLVVWLTWRIATPARKFKL